MGLVMLLGLPTDEMDTIIHAIRDLGGCMKIAAFRFEDRLRMSGEEAFRRSGEEAFRRLHEETLRPFLLEMSSIFTYQKQRVGPQVRRRTFFKGTKEYVYFVKVDPDGIASEPMGQVWHRTDKKQLKPKQAPPRRLRFWTANRCDHNRGRSWDRKAA